MLRKRLFRVLLPAAVTIGVPVYLWAATFGGFGGRLAQAQETGFFKWFHLTQTAREKTAGVTVTSFKPNGQKFRDLVTKNQVTFKSSIIKHKSRKSPSLPPDLKLGIIT